MEKQIEKAKSIIDNPSKGKKLKFTTTKGQQLELNQKLIDKTHIPLQRRTDKTAPADLFYCTDPIHI